MMLIEGDLGESVSPTHLLLLTLLDPAPLLLASRLPAFLLLDFLLLAFPTSNFSYFELPYF